MEIILTIQIDLTHLSFHSVPGYSLNLCCLSLSCLSFSVSYDKNYKDMTIMKIVRIHQKRLGRSEYLYILLTH